jgi:tetratricopeptide (TPR) repeat protein
LALFSKTSKTKTTVNMTLTTQSQERLFREAGGHLELGLTDASEELIANYEALFGEDPRSLTLRKSIASRRGDYDTHAILARERFDDSLWPLTDLHAVSAAGDPAWAYEKIKALQNESDNPLYWFNRACFASRVGEFRDSVLSLLVSFCISARYHADAFLDPDLLPLWRWMRESELDDTIAECIADPSWQEAMNALSASSEPLTVTPLMWCNVPQCFRSYIPHGSATNGLYPSASMPRALYNHYLAWQKKTASREAEIVQEAFNRARKYLLMRQPTFAHWQAKNGNPTAARYHILFYLAIFPDRLPDFEPLRDLGMGYVLDDLSAALSEDPQFAAVMRAATMENCVSEALELLDDIGPLGKETTIYKMRLGALLHEAGRVEPAIRLFAEVVESWPLDASGYSGLSCVYIRSGRWCEARLSFNAAPSHFQRFKLHVYQREQIGSEASADPSHSRFASQPFYGQRHLGGALFSDWMRCEEDKRRKKISQPD